MKIHKDGLGTIALIWVICIAISLACILLIPTQHLPLAILKWVLVAVFVFIMGFSFYFFRVPKRVCVDQKRAVTSVADGEVVLVEQVYEPEHLKCECIQVSVYMDFFNVHVNYWPISGEVTYYKYHPGRYLLAFLPKASELNEHTSVAIKNKYGEVFFKQLAGTFARRIVCYAKVGESGEQGKQCGIIKFGSRIDMYLPLDCDIQVCVGDHVRACETVIAELKDVD